MVGAVDLEMAVGALSVVHEPHRGCIGRSCSRAAVCRRMALLAQTRPRNLEHLFLVASVRIVTVCAILRHRNVFPQVRPAFFGVAAEARFIHRGREEQLVVRRAVGAVATRALHLAFAERHVREPRQLRLLLRMAVATGLDHRLRLEIASLRRRVHHRVTVGARDIA